MKCFMVLILVNNNNPALRNIYRKFIIEYFGYTLFWYSTLDILLTISNFVTACQLTLITVLVDYSIMVSRIRWHVRYLQSYAY